MEDISVSRILRIKPHSPQDTIDGGSGPGALASDYFVVDDHEPLRRLLTRILTEEGYPVLQAGDGVEALELISAGTSIQLVITDIVMPKMDGCELEAALRAATRPVPVLFMSGFGQSHLELPGPLLQKPFTGERLMAEVRRLLPPVQ
jgi:CheY-like chemotaxis protein